MVKGFLKIKENNLLSKIVFFLYLVYNLSLILMMVIWKYKFMFGFCVGVWLLRMDCGDVLFYLNLLLKSYWNKYFIELVYLFGVKKFVNFVCVLIYKCVRREFDYIFLKWIFFVFVW